MKMPTNLISLAWLQPMPFFTGILLILAFDAVLGRWAVEKSHFGPFERFHKMISPENFYYPTALQVRNRLLQEIDPQKITVLIGGSSIIYGSAQRLEKLWSHHLQELLGTNFQVFNLARPGGNAQEIAMPLAEHLLQKSYKIILIVNGVNKTFVSRPDGRLFKDFFWDAYYKKLLTSYSDRKEHLNLLYSLKNEEDITELRIQMWLNSLFYFNDLWSVVGYEYLFTIWNRFDKKIPWFCARKYALEKEKTPKPFHERYKIEDYEKEMKIVRQHAAPWKDKALQLFERGAKTCTPPFVRETTIVVITPDSPYYTQQLSDLEKNQYHQNLLTTVNKLTSIGYHTFLALTNATDVDFADHCHISEEGSPKLAEATVSHIQQLSQKLGYSFTKNQ